MSNVKRIEIRGFLPFDAHEDKYLQPYLAAFTAPSIGLGIKYGSKTKTRGNEFGGRTTLYPFKIGGEEAVSFQYVEALCCAIRTAGGSVDYRQVIDIENEYAEV